SLRGDLLCRMRLQIPAAGARLSHSGAETLSRRFRLNHTARTVSQTSAPRMYSTEPRTRVIRQQNFFFKFRISVHRAGNSFKDSPELASLSASCFPSLLALNLRINL